MKRGELGKWDVVVVKIIQKNKKTSAACYCKLKSLKQGGFQNGAFAL